MQERGRLLRAFNALQQVQLASSQRGHLALDVVEVLIRDSALHHFDDLPDLTLNLLELTFGGREARALFHPRFIHGSREFVAKHLESIALKEAGLQGAEHARLNLLAADSERIRTDAAFTMATAGQAVNRADHVAAAADTTADQS
ncbi:MAG TPA: hypothetical protein VGZ27_16120 [Vicinamibacterales bacterium]|nr:hypothetical protein [Vicinamibacterales bacterium]